MWNETPGVAAADTPPPQHRSAGFPTARGAADDRPLSRQAIAFRATVLDRIADDKGGVGYIDRDRVIGRCPICSGSLSVAFAGPAPRIAAIRCSTGCSRHDLLERLAFGATTASPEVLE